MLALFSPLHLILGEGFLALFSKKHHHQSMRCSISRSYVSQLCRYRWIPMTKQIGHLGVCESTEKMNLRVNKFPDGLCNVLLAYLVGMLREHWILTVRQQDNAIQAIENCISCLTVVL